MASTNLTNARILDQQFGAVSPTVPATYYVALSTTTPTIAGANFTEPSTIGTAYARVAIDNDKITWSNASSSALTNDIEITFPESTGSWGTITYVGFYDASGVGTGNLLYYGSLSPSRAIATGTVLYFAAGDITVSVVNA